MFRTETNYQRERERERERAQRERVKTNRESYHKERDSSEMGRSRESSEMLELEDASWSSSELEMRQWSLRCVY